MEPIKSPPRSSWVQLERCATRASVAATAGDSRGRKRENVPILKRDRHMATAHKSSSAMTTVRRSGDIRSSRLTFSAQENPDQAQYACSQTLHALREIEDLL
jgi:hypothetical protein